MTQNTFLEFGLLFFCSWRTLFLLFLFVAAGISNAVAAAARPRPPDDESGEMPVVLVSAVRAQTRALAIAGLRAAASRLATPSPQGGLSRGGRDWLCLPPQAAPAGCRLASDTREFVPATTPAANFRYPVGTPVYCCACPSP